MNEFLEQVKSLNWWIGVVLVGLLINLCSAYLKPKIDKFLGQYSQRKREKNEAKRAKRLAEISRLNLDKNEQIQSLISANYIRLRSISYLLMAIIVWLISEIAVIRFEFLISVGLKAFAVLLIFLSQKDMSKSYEYREMVHEAKELKVD